MVARMMTEEIADKLSLMIKMAELLYRDHGTLKDEDICYYLDEIVAITKECKEILKPECQDFE